ncbi:MAG: large conductance mechanosensitive channel protein MscL [Chloroflexi bacterium]|nr:large conductance mechanosensitive channel protein MscL [Chloroflexota bacterium]
MWKELKAFLMRGNVIDLAVAVISGAAFTAIVNSLVKDIIMPPISVLLGGVDFTQLFINLSSTHYDTLAAAQEAGAPTINYGNFIAAVVNFLVVSTVLFFLIKGINAAKKPRAEEPVTKECPFCKSNIAIAATRCPNCTSQLEPADAVQESQK